MTAEWPIDRRLGMNLSFKGATALSELLAMGEGTKTDIVNGALERMLYITKALDSGAKLYLERPGVEGLENVVFL
jgi:hypothetical protein